MSRQKTVVGSMQNRWESEGATPSDKRKEVVEAGARRITQVILFIRTTLKDMPDSTMAHLLNAFHVEAATDEQRADFKRDTVAAMTDENCLRLFVELERMLQSEGVNINPELSFFREVIEATDEDSA